MAPYTRGHYMGDDEALRLFLVATVLDDADDSCDCESCAARAESTDEKERGEELGLLLGKRLLRNIQDNHENSRVVGLSLLHSFLVEENGPPLSSASKMALMSSDTFEILAEAVQDRRLPSWCTVMGIVIIMNIIETDDHISTFVEAMGGLQGLAGWMKYHFDDAFTCGLISNVLSRIVQSGLFEDEASCWHSEGLVGLMVEALEMHLAKFPVLFRIFIRYIPAAWPILRPYDRRIRDCIMEAMSSHIDDEDCQRLGEEVLTEINDPLDDLRQVLLEAADEGNCSAAA
jgi:hypothetical protein